MYQSPIDFADIQGLARYGYGALKQACFFLLKIQDARAARDWLATADFNNAIETATPPKTALQVAFTSAGLRALGVAENIVDQFSPEFISGMSGEENRSRRLADVGVSAPRQWQWGGPKNVPDLILMLYGQDPDFIERRQSLLSSFPRLGLQLQHTPLATVDQHDREPFGFRDGVSQPTIDWNGERKLDGCRKGEYGNLLALGELLLGYQNEYGIYTDRPLVGLNERDRPPLFTADNVPSNGDLGRNGCYLVFRQLEQDVRAFWQFLDKQANGVPALRRNLAEAMVGRTIDGEPLVVASDHPIEGVGNVPADIELNQFTYESDAMGRRCPFGAHVRRANPRTGDLPGSGNSILSRLLRVFGFGRKTIRDDLIASARFHRIVRRGREYGSALSAEDAVASSGSQTEEERGLHFICLCANISRQFEFVQNAWIMTTKFNGLSDESDPLLGNRRPLDGCLALDSFSLAQDSAIRRRVVGLPQFVTVRGGAYFFLPGIRALRYLASCGG